MMGGDARSAKLLSGCRVRHGGFRQGHRGHGWEDLKGRRVPGESGPGYLQGLGAGPHCPKALLSWPFHTWELAGALKERPSETLGRREGRAVGRCERGDTSLYVPRRSA